ncbi:TetR/AcrR family transcriptional regulator [Pararhizobium capsulatum]|nr:TetR/AcrR family transcriptional regulator [Pararhizobium capsulatum]
MSLAHHRLKRPRLVRQQLLEVAARLSLENGVASVTLDAVSQAAGVSKGGLLHHFPSKMALLDGLFEDLTSKFDHAIDEEVRNDPVAHGRFSRAYLSVVFPLGDETGQGHEEAQGWRVLTIALLAEPVLRDRWRQWVGDRADEFVGTDSSTNCLLVRMAADGLWLADILHSHDIGEEERMALFSNLKTLSFQ